MGLGWVSGVNAAKGMAIVLLGVMLSGCLGADQLDAEEILEPYTRISGWGEGSGGGASCFIFSSLPDPQWCMDVEFGFTDFLCDPPQLLLAMLDGWAASQQAFLKAVEAGQQAAPLLPDTSAAGAYVYCEYALEWSITARSLPPDSQFHVTVSHDGQEKASTCEIPFNSECSTGGRIDGKLTFQGPGETVGLLARLDAEIETIVPPELPIGGPGGDASLDLRLNLST